MPTRALGLRYLESRLACKWTAAEETLRSGGNFAQLLRAGQCRSAPSKLGVGGGHHVSWGSAPCMPFSLGSEEAAAMGRALMEISDDEGPRRTYFLYYPWRFGTEPLTDAFGMVRTPFPLRLFA